MKKTAIIPICMIAILLLAVYFVFIQKQGPVNRLFGRLSSFTVSSISIQSVTRPLREVVLEEEDQNKLIELLRKEHYEGNDDPEYASTMGEPTIYYSIRIQTKGGADILLTFTPKHCICCPDEFEGDATSKSEKKGYPVSKDGRDEHQQVMDFFADLLSKHFPDDNVKLRFLNVAELGDNCRPSEHGRQLFCPLLSKRI